MRIMSLDLGDKTIGIAVSDSMRIIANGVETIRRKGIVNDFKRLEELVNDHEVSKFIVGYPKNMNGSIGERAKKSEIFAKELGERFKELEIVLWDERLSTVAAEKVLIKADMQRKKRKKIIDMMAAVVILQNFLDNANNKA